ncbi:hypothetical protein ACWDBF_16765 [Streptomyces angustmyceticus]
MTTATNTTITKDTITAALREVVKESPDKVYEAPAHMDREGNGLCFYVHTDTEGNTVGAGCIVGTVLHRLGVPLEALARVEGLSATGALQSLDINPDTHLGEELRKVQIRQDDGETWALAYRQVFGEEA